MKALKWIASIVLIIGVAGFSLFTLAGFGIKSRAKPDPPPLELIPESVRNLPVMIDELYENSIEGELLETTLIDGFPCVAGRVHFTRSGQLTSCTIAEDVVIQNNLIPQNTTVDIYKEPDRHVFTFPEDTEIQGYQVSKLVTYSFFDNIPFMKALINRKEYIVNLLSYKEMAAAPLSVP